MTPTLDDRRIPCERPSDRVVMHQNWRDLLFLHWRVDPALVASTLPPGLSVDTFDGSAWIGLVPFLMRDIRPPRLPSVSPISNFLEMNVRTYVFDRDFRPGVWFYSLEANQPLAVAVARHRFFLPYLWATMSETRRDGSIVYRCARRGETRFPPNEIVYAGGDPLPQPEPGSFEYFLLERYLLFAWHEKRKRLFSGQVHHAPYPVQTARYEIVSECALRQAGFDYADAPPEHAIYSPGVDVDVFALKPIADNF